VPLSLILGPANSAKAGEVLGAYSAAAAAPGGALLVVPTAADARHYDRELAADGIALGRTVTFGGLIAEIARRTGYDPVRVAPLHRQQLILRAVAEQPLATLQRSADSPGFAGAVGRLFAELRGARVMPPRFVAAMRAWAAERPERTDYAEDLSQLYMRYDRALAAVGALDTETFAWGTLDALRAATDAWLGTPVFVYGFDDLTAIELDAVDTLASAVGTDVTVSLTYEPGRLALLARAGVVEDLRERAASVRELPALQAHYASAAAVDLHQLERYLFESAPSVIDPGDAVRLMEAGGARAEAELVGAAVLGALRDGVPLAEIVVIARSLTSSGALLEQVLTRYGVPVASARTVPLAHTPIGAAVMALVRCAFDQVNATAADVLTYLRHPGVAEADAVDRLERTLGELGLNSAQQALNVGGADGLPLGCVAELAGAEAPTAVLSEQVRALLAAAAAAAAAAGAGATAPLPAAEALDARAAALLLRALEQLSTPTPVELLALLPGIEVPVSASSGTSVLIAEPLAIRARRFRRVFVTGMCEGEFPTGGATDPFLGEDRRRELALASGVVLPAADDDAARERYLLYACVSRATEQVTFSYRSAEEDGSVVRHSPFLDDVAALFVEDWWARRTRRLLADVVWPAASAPTARDHALAVAATATAAASTPPTATGNETRTLGAAALAHVRHREVVSGSALELFGVCPVRWLVERQLQPQDLEPEGQAMAKGTFLHQVLERVLRSLGAPLTSATLPVADQALAAEMRVLPPEMSPGLSPAVRAAILRGIEADLKRFLRYEADDASGWTPREFELEFETELRSGDQTVGFRGTIDRIDVAADGRRAVLRDYKSGAGRVERSAAKWIEGGVLQVGLYMIAARRLLELEPVAGLYQPLTGSELRPRGAYLAGTELGSHTYSTDALDRSELDALLEEVERAALELVTTIRRGELTPCPATCSREGCAHPGICWA